MWFIPLCPGQSGNSQTNTQSCRNKRGDARWGIPSFYLGLLFSLNPLFHYDGLSSLSEGLQIKCVDLGGEMLEEISLPGLLLDIEEIGEGAQGHHIDGPCIATLDGDLKPFNGVNISIKIFFKSFHHTLRVLHLPEIDGRREYLLFVQDDFPLVLDPVNIAEPLQEFKGDEVIHIPIFDEGGVHLFPESKMGRDIPSPLGHSMDLAFFHIITRFMKHRAEDVTGKDGPLPSDS